MASNTFYWRDLANRRMLICIFIGFSSGLPLFILLNLVDFDMLWGHRNDPQGMRGGLEQFDRWLGGFLPRLRAGDLLLMTADHGNDPTTPSTDHSREYVPVLALTGRQHTGRPLGTRASFADLGQTVAEYFGLTPMTHGASFLGLLG